MDILNFKPNKESFVIKFFVSMIYMTFAFIIGGALIGIFGATIVLVYHSIVN